VLSCPHRGRVPQAARAGRSLGADRGGGVPGAWARTGPGGGAAPGQTCTVPPPCLACPIPPPCLACCGTLDAPLDAVGGPDTWDQVLGDGVVRDDNPISL